MIAHYLDPSAWVKRYFQETGSDAVARVFSESQRVCCSSIGIVEIAATIARKGRFERLASETLVTLLAQAHVDFAVFQRIAVSDELLHAAVSLAFDFGLRAGDAIHLASAVSLKHDKEITQIIMVSADVELLAAASSKGLLTLNPSRE